MGEFSVGVLALALFSFFKVTVWIILFNKCLKLKHVFRALNRNFRFEIQNILMKISFLSFHQNNQSPFKCSLQQKFQNIDFVLITN